MISARHLLVAVFGVVLLSGLLGGFGVPLQTVRAASPAATVMLRASRPAPLPPIARARVAPAFPLPAGGVPNVAGQVILVSISQQWLWAYHNGTLVFQTPVTTGKPGNATPTGTYQVQFKVTNLLFTSPWPPGSPNYYAPLHVNYALFFLYDGFYIHDAPWRQTFGPGTDVPHTEPNGTPATGSHGCVEVPTAAGRWLYQWAQDGATIVIR